MNMAIQIAAFGKTKKVIESCKTVEQLKVANRMIDNFKSLYGISIYSEELDWVYLRTLTHWGEKQ